jgi:hypothetical protein
MPQPQPIFRPDDGGDDEDREIRENGGGGDRQPFYPGAQPAYGSSDPQPYVNGNDQDLAGGDNPPAGDVGGGRDRGGHQGGFRRRRPFRERYGDRGGDHGGGEPGGRSEGGGGGSSQLDD